MAIKNKIMKNITIKHLLITVGALMYRKLGGMLMGILSGLFKKS